MRPKFLIIILLTVVSVLSACDGSRQYRSLPDGVSAAVAWNEQRGRWHIGAFIEGDRPESLLRVLCITEAGAAPQFDDDHLLTGINIDVSIAKDEGHGSLEGEWVIDERKWDGVRWARSHGTVPPSFEAPSEQGADALYQALRDARTATFTSLASIDRRPLITTAFDIEALFSTTNQPLLDQCRNDTLHDLLPPDPVAITAYWFAEQERHHFVAGLPDLQGMAYIFLNCAPSAIYDEVPFRLSDANETEITISAGIILQEEVTLSGNPIVQWSSNVVGRERTRWKLEHRALVALSHIDQLKFYDALRRSNALDVVVEPDNPDIPGGIHLQIASARALSGPLGPEIDGCFREYADTYER